VILLLFVAWIVFLVAVPIWAWSKIDKVDAEPAGARPAESPGTTYLLVGSDSRAGLSTEQEQELGTGDASGQRTDTIMLLHITSGGGPNVLLSIPRDSYVDIPGHGMNKINAAFAFGGPQLLVQTVEHATDLRIDDYVEIGFTGFVDIVDAVGGVEICPKTAMKDAKAKLDIPAGCQDADGATALGYVRSRHSDALGDIGRGQRQRQVVSAVAGKATSATTVLLPWRYFNLSSSAADSLRIGDNVGPVDLAKFAWSVSHISDGLTCVVPYSSLGETTSVGAVVVWDAQAAQALFQHLADDDTSKVDCSATGQ
jgi:LCP family protein required for cell wall assembly